MLDDGEILSTVQSIIASSDVEGELQEERASALDRYFGKPYGDEVAGRSQVVARDTLETIEWFMPSLMRIFGDADNIVEFDPVGPDDDDQAKQESDAVWHVFWKQNDGFLNSYTACKDALLSKTGILKTYWDGSKEETREEYSGLSDEQALALLGDPTVTRELIEAERGEDGLLSVSFRAIQSQGRIRIESVPPEEFGIHVGARSPRAKEALACWQRRTMTASDLVKMGVPLETVKTLPGSEASGDEEQTARRRTDDEDETGGDALHESTREIWVTETYTYIDRNEDGIAELLKITTAGLGGSEGSGLVLIEGDDFEGIEEVDQIPFSTTTPYITTHKFHGQSVADMVSDLERINTALNRGVLDNLYLSNNPEKAVDDEAVWIPDIQAPRPGNIVRVTTNGQPVAGFIQTLGHTPVPPQTFEMLDRIDQQRKQRTGVGDEVSGLDASALANVNTGVAALAFDAARGKVELIARIFAETLFRDVFLDIRTLLTKHTDRPMMLRLREEWVSVQPNTWRTRTESTVRVGIGQVSRERRLQALETIMEKQALVVQGGGLGTLVMPDDLYRSVRDYTEAWGLEPSLYWTDPASVPPKPPEGPSPEQELAVAQVGLIKEQNQIALFRAQAEAQAKARDSELKAQEMQLKAELERVKSGIKAVESDAKQESDTRKVLLEDQQKRVDQQLEALKLEQDRVNAERDHKIELYQANLNATMAAMSRTGGLSASPDAPDLMGTLQASIEGFKALADMTIQGLERLSSAQLESTEALRAQLEQQSAIISSPRRQRVSRGEDGLISEVISEIALNG